MQKLCEKSFFSTWKYLNLCSWFFWIWCVCLTNLEVIITNEAWYLIRATIFSCYLPKWMALIVTRWYFNISVLCKNICHEQLPVINAICTKQTRWRYAMRQTWMHISHDQDLNISRTELFKWFYFIPEIINISN